MNLGSARNRNVARSCWGMVGAIAIFCWTPPANGLVPNGSFESNSINTGGAGYFGDVPDDWSLFNGLYFNPTPDVFDDLGIAGELPGSFTAFIGVAPYAGHKFVGLAANLNNINMPGFTEGIYSNPIAINANVNYTLQLALLHDSTNSVGYNAAAPLIVRLRQGAGAGTVIGSMAANTSPKTWEIRTLSFQVPTAGLYELVLSNESPHASYLGVDDVRLLPEPGVLSLAWSIGIAALASHPPRTRNQRVSASRGRN